MTHTISNRIDYLLQDTIATTVDVKSPSSSTAVNTEFYTIITTNMTSPQAQPSDPPVIDLDADDTQSELTSLHSGETPTLPGDEAPTIKALADAATEAEYQLCVDKIPRNHKTKIGGILYVQYEPYRPRKSKRTAWYWEQGEELIRTNKG